MAFAQNKDVELAGDVLLFALPSTALGSTIVLGDGKGTWQFVKGFTMNQAITLGLKYATDKNRPFNNGERAFPSGHTSTTFHSAAFIQRRYGWKYGLPAYALAGFTGFSRIDARKHDGWDILAGAIVGIGSAYLFTSPYMEDHFELAFSGGKGTYLLRCTYRF